MLADQATVTVFGWAFGIAFGCAMAFGWAWWRELQANRRIYEYASRKANEGDLMDPARWAYSDMATVVALDGRVPVPSSGEENTHG